MTLAASGEPRAVSWGLTERARTELVTPPRSTGSPRGKTPSSPQNQRALLGGSLADTGDLGRCCEPGMQTGRWGRS